MSDMVGNLHVNCWFSNMNAQLISSSSFFYFLFTCLFRLYFEKKKKRQNLLLCLFFLFFHTLAARQIAAEAIQVHLLTSCQKDDTDISCPIFVSTLKCTPLKGHS